MNALSLFLLADAATEANGGSPEFLEKYSATIMLLVMVVMGLSTLLVLVPRLLRARQQRLELQHIERLKCLELGQMPPHPDERSIAAGRTASLVPMVVMCAASAVTCFLAAYRPDQLFAVGVATWCVSGAVSLAAITGGVALMGRLAHLHAGIEEETDEGPEEEGQDNGRGGRIVG
jgi:hypothetical protein